MTDEAPGGAEHERVDGGRPRFEDADRPARHLGEDVEPVGLGLLDQPEVLSPQVRRVIGLVEVEHDRLAGDPGDGAHPRERVGHLGMVGGGLEDAMADLGD